MGMMVWSVGDVTPASPGDDKPDRRLLHSELSSDHRLSDTITVHLTNDRNVSLGQLSAIVLRATGVVAEIVMSLMLLDMAAVEGPEAAQATAGRGRM
ncbi:hypothetical protein ABIA15_002821 [Sinorhizobium fredii]